MRLIIHVAVICLIVGQAAPTPAQTPSLQDVAGPLGDRTAGVATIYIAREFLTMDPALPRVQAVAVRDGKFVARGSLDEVKAVVGAEANVNDSFASKVVVAGFVEQHVHPVLAALTMQTKVISIEDWDAVDGFSPAVRDEPSYRERLADALADHDRTKPFVTWGYHHYFHGPMSRGLLNELAKEFPVVVWQRSCHEFYLNDKALERVGIDESLVKSLSTAAQSQIDFAKGHFYEQGAIAVLPKLAPLIATPEIFRTGLEFTEAYYHRNGITVACEPGGFYSKPMQEAINAVYSDDATPFNHYFIADGKSMAALHKSDPAAMLAETELVLPWGRGRTRFLPKQVKLLTDGAIFSQLMMMRDGYTDGHEGAWIIDPPAFDVAFQAYWDAGYQIHVHNNGDAGLDVLLTSLEKAMRRRPRQDHRTVLVHFGFAQPEQVKRWGRLGGIVSANPYYVTALAGRYDEVGIGPERAANIAPLRHVVESDIPLSFHSDMPMAPAKPLQLVWAGVNRWTFEGDVAGPQHRVNVDQALRAITIDAAHSIQLEDRVGSIEVGKDANLTVLSQSPFDAPPMEIKNIAVWGTMLEGRVQPAPSPDQTASHVTPSTRQLALAATRRQNASYWRSFAPRSTDEARRPGSCSCDMVAELSRALVSKP